MYDSLETIDFFFCNFSIKSSQWQDIAFSLPLVFRRFSKLQTNHSCALQFLGGNWSFKFFKYAINFINFQPHSFKMFLWTKKMVLHKLLHPIVHFSEPFLGLNGKSRKRAGAPIFLLLSVPATNKSTIRLKSFFTSSVKLSLLQLLWLQGY